MSKVSRKIISWNVNGIRSRTSSSATRTFQKAAAQLMPRVKEAFIDVEVLGSDHCPVGIVLG